MQSTPDFSGPAVVASVNLGSPRPNPYKQTQSTGIEKRPVARRVEVRAPGPKHGGLGSGLVGDFIGDQSHHGGDGQAVYAVAREDLDAWERRLGRRLPNGFFGENLTTTGIDVNAARIGERWRIAPEDASAPGIELEVTGPRIPCSTFRGWVGETGWLKMFTQVARPGAYFRVVEAGTIGAGDVVSISRSRHHEVTVSLVYRATTTERELLPRLLEAGDDLPDELRQMVIERVGFDLD
jgi:MOSC domain-containing protein YiiM